MIGYLKKTKVSNIFTSLKYEIAAFALNHLIIDHVTDQTVPPDTLFIERTVWPLDNDATTMATQEDLQYYRGGKNKFFNDPELGLHHLKFLVRPGRLAQALEGAGKRRLFAIGNTVRDRFPPTIIIKTNPFGSLIKSNSSLRNDELPFALESLPIDFAPSSFDTKSVSLPKMVFSVTLFMSFFILHQDQRLFPSFHLHVLSI